MKKLLVLFALISLFFSSCATMSSSTGSEVSNFTTIHDDIMNTTYINHKILNSWSPAGLAFTNIHDGLPRIHLQMYIANNEHLFTHFYCVLADWIFTEKVVLISSDGRRLELSKQKRKDTVLRGSGVVVEEEMVHILTKEEKNELYFIAKAEHAYIAFVGDKTRTEKYEIKPRTKAAIIEMILKYESITGNR